MFSNQEKQRNKIKTIKNKFQ